MDPSPPVPRELRLWRAARVLRGPLLLTASNPRRRLAQPRAGAAWCTGGARFPSRVSASGWCSPRNELGTAYGHIAVGVSELDATLVRLKEQGIEPEREPLGRLMALLRPRSEMVSF